MLDGVMDLADAVLAAPSPIEATAAFHAGMASTGATYLQTRVYRRPRDVLTSANHWAAGGFVARYARPGWEGSGAFNYICFDCNPLLEPIRQRQTRYRFSDFAPRRDRAYGAYWEAMGEAGIGDALCATSYAPGGRIASLHLGFAEPFGDRAGASAIQLAGLILVDKLLSFDTGTDEEERIALTARERDALLFVAQGKTDWEIGAILGISETTARFHVDNARRKLDAVNRAHAVARFIAQHGLV